MSFGARTPGRPLIHRPVMHYQPYRPLYPTSNGFLQRKWDRTAYEIHRRKVDFALPVVDTYPPKTFRPEKPQKLKKLKLGEELSKATRWVGAMDSKKSYERKSLNRDQRRREMARINKENEHNRYRLRQCRSHYEVKIFHQEWLQTLKMRERITLYPPRAGNQPKYQDSASHHIPWNSDYDSKQERYHGGTHKRAMSKANSVADVEESKTTKRTQGRGLGRMSGQSVPPGHVNLPRLYVSPAFW